MRRFDGIDRPRSPPVRIGRERLDRVRRCVLPGVTIGEGAVVGARSVVTDDVEPYSVVAGNPARLVRRLDRSEEHQRQSRQGHEQVSRGKIIVFGILFWYPLAGVTYQFLHYLSGCAGSATTRTTSRTRAAGSTTRR